MSGTKLAIAAQRGLGRLDLTFKDEADRIVGSVVLGRDSIDTFISQLVAAREALRQDAPQAPGVPSNGIVTLPPPVQYYTMTGGIDRGSGLPVLGFKVGPDLWLSFRIEPEGIPALARLLAAETAKAAAK